MILSLSWSSRSTQQYNACLCLLSTPLWRGGKKNLFSEQNLIHFRAWALSARSNIAQHWDQPAFMSTRYFHYPTFSVSEQWIVSEKQWDKERDYCVCCRRRRCARPRRRSHCGMSVSVWFQSSLCVGCNHLISTAEKSRWDNGNFKGSMRFWEPNLHLQRVFQQMNGFDGSVKRWKSNTFLIFITQQSKNNHSTKNSLIIIH